MVTNLLRRASSTLIVVVLLALASIEPAQAQAQAKDFNVPAQSATTGIPEFARQAGIQILVSETLVHGKSTTTVTGTHSVEQALTILLQGTGLIATSKDGATFTIVAVSLAPSTSGGATTDKKEGKSSSSRDFRVSQRDQGTARASAVAQDDKNSGNKKDELEEIKVSIPEILVTGSRTLDMDIKRTQDDAQPYVVFDRQQIEESQATNLETFLKDRLSMNASPASSAQQVTNGNVGGNISSIDLHGLGTGQTLILIDGHRTASIATAGASAQPDINGIPMSAVERIEVLPTTASGIYGGSATGGVINIILRRDYSGIESKITYGGTFSGGAPSRQVDVTAGFNTEEGKTNILLAASFADQGALNVGERNLYQRGQQTILANNPSAFYGSGVPPLGATTNVLSADGSPLVLLNGKNLNSPFTFVPAGYLGATSDGGAALLANAGRYNLTLPNTAQNGGLSSNLASASKVDSVMATIRHEFSADVQAFVELSAANNHSSATTNSVSSTFLVPAGAPTNPFANSVYVTIPAYGTDGDFTSNTDERRILTGVIVKLPRNWQAEADVTYTHNSFYNAVPGGFLPDPVTFQSYAQDAINSGKLNVFHDLPGTTLVPFLAGPTTLGPSAEALGDLTVRASGPVWSSRGGETTLSMSIEHRRETLSSSEANDPTNPSFFDYPSQSQSVDSAYAEIVVPILSSLNALPGAQLLELQVAGRWDRYTTHASSGVIDLTNPSPIFMQIESGFSSANPTVALRYRPLSGITWRSSYGTGFLPPTANQLAPGVPDYVPPSLAAQLGLTDPRRGNEIAGGTAGFSILTNGNPALKPESSTSYSTGLIFEPTSVPGLRASIDWTRIDKRGNIVPVGTLTEQDFVNEQYVPGLIVRGPVPPGSPYSVGPVTAINLEPFNVARTHVESYDVALDYRVQTTSFGTFAFNASATHLQALATQLTAASPVVDYTGVSGANATTGGLRWKASDTITWSYDRWTVSWASRFIDSYWLSADHSINANQGSARIPSQIYQDLFASYRWPSAERHCKLLENSELQLGARNFLNRRPPVDVSWPAGYSSWGDPRLASYYISLRKAF